MYLNDIQRSGFYAAIGLDAREYDIYVIKKTNETAAQVFPVMLDVENPGFTRLDICIKNNEKLSAITLNTPIPAILPEAAPFTSPMVGSSCGCT